MRRAGERVALLGIVSKKSDRSGFADWEIAVRFAWRRKGAPWTIVQGTLGESSGVLVVCVRRHAGSDREIAKQ